jgi:hypothetical protein
MCIFFVCCIASAVVLSVAHTIYYIEWLDDTELQMGANGHVLLQGTILAPAWRNWRNSWKTSEYSVNMASPKYMSDVLLLESTCSVNVTCKICEKTRNICKTWHGSLIKDHLLTYHKRRMLTGLNWLRTGYHVTRLLNIYFCNSRTFLKQMSTAVTF